MKKGRRYNSRLGKLFFILPAAVIIVLVVYAYVELNAPATLIVRAEPFSCTQAQATSTGNCELSATATVDGRSGQTPWTLTLPSGSYVVDFSSLSWYYPPSARDVSMAPGVTSYAVSVYSPITRIIQVTPEGFNTTTVTAFHSLTPVNWTNPSSSDVTFRVPTYGDVSLIPGQSFRFIFASAGAYNCTLLSTKTTVTVDVS